MAAFLRLDVTTNPDSLKAASGTDYEYAVNQILVAFAATDTGVGTLSINPASTTGLTSIGTFADTYYPYDQLQHPIPNTITTINYTFYQDLQTATETLTRPVEFSTTALREQNDTALNADLISTALANLVSLGVGSYALQPAAPVGGTWIQKSYVTNYLDGNELTYIYFWRKTAAASAPATTLRPVKINATSPVSIKSMSDAEIQTLTDRLRNRIVATGIGKYAIQASAPVGGTWTTAGAQVFDTTRTISDIAYNGTYAGSYIGSFTGAYTGQFTGSYAGTYAGTSFAGSYNQSFSGLYLRPYVGGYFGSYTGRATYNGFARAGTSVAYTGQYFGTYSSLASKAYTAAFTGNYVANYTGAYAGSYNQAFSGTYSQSFTGSYTRAFSGLTLNNDSVNISSVYLWIRTA